MSKLRKQALALTLSLVLLTLSVLGGASAVLAAEEGPDSSTSPTESTSIPDSVSESSGEQGEDSSSEISSAPDSSESEADSETVMEDEAGLLDELLPDGSLQLDAVSVEVYNFVQLSNALSQDNGFTNIYLGDNITTTAGIEISNTKASVMIDGRNTYAIYQHASTSITEGIFVRATNTVTRTVEMRNLTFHGENYYGALTSAENTALSGLTFIFRNVTYDGPQLTFHRYGALEIIDCTISLRGSTNGAIPTNELCETNRLTMAGATSVTVTTATTGNSIVWLTHSASSFTVAANARITINTPHYFLYADGGSPQFTVGAGASLVINAADGFIHNSFSVQNLTVEAGAGFEMYHTNAGSNRRMRISGSLTVNNGASFIYSRASASEQAIEFTAAGSISLNDPQRVKIYNASNELIRFSGSSTLSISAGAINRWTAASSLSGPGAPDYIWNKADNGELATLVASYSGTTLQSVSTNIAPGTDPVPTAPGATTFSLTGTHLLSAGRLDLTIDDFTNQSPAITGNVSSPATLSAAYQGTNGAATASGTGSGGRYTIPLSGVYAVVGTQVSVTARNDDLYKIHAATVLDASDYVLALVEVPPTLVYTGAIPAAPTLIYRTQDTMTLRVRDDRLSPGYWQLQASAPNLTGEQNGTTYTLNEALVFVDDGGNTTPLSTAALPVYTQQTGQSGETVLTYPRQRGILLLANPNEIQSGVTYETTITWSLVDAP